MNAQHLLEQYRPIAEAQNQLGMRLPVTTWCTPTFQAQLPLIDFIRFLRDNAGQLHSLFYGHRSNGLFVNIQTGPPGQK